jgi:hypothetical protein
MTANRRSKRAVRSPMEQTGEKYIEARRALLSWGGNNGGAGDDPGVTITWPQDSLGWFSDTHVAGHRQQGTTRRNVHGDRAKLPVQHRHLLAVAQRDHDHPDQPVQVAGAVLDALRRRLTAGRGPCNAPLW